jgi:hypothetical protein
MRVVSSTPASLVLAHRPVVVPAIAAALVVGVIYETAGDAPTLGAGQWAAAGMGILVGCFISYLSALRTRIVFDAARGEVRWKHSGWPGRGLGSCPLAEVAGVEVISSPGAERLALSTSEGLVPLTRHFSGIEPHQKNALAIREWLSQYEAGHPAENDR